MQTKRLMLLGVFLLGMFLIAATDGTAHAEDAQWRARFWNNKNQSGDPVLERHDSSIDFNWGDGAPAANVNDDNFSARWNRTVNFDPGTYRFTATMDDAMRVYLDGNLIIDSWTDSQEHTLTKDVYVSGGEHALKVDYYEAGGVAIARFSWQLVQPAGATSGSGGGAFYPNWKAEYFNNTTLSGAPALVRDDAYMDNDWGLGSPAPGVINNDYFSARWTKTISGDPGTYTVIMTSDDGSRLYVNNVLLIDNWAVQGPTTKTATYNYTGGPLLVRVEYFDQTGGAEIEVHLISTSGGAVTIPSQPTGSGNNSCGPYAGSIAYVNVASLNFRDGPATAFPIIQTLPQCTAVELTGYRNPVGTNAGDWVQVVLLDSGQVAWAALDYLSTEVPTSSLTVLSD
ncbi:MAG: PA14 domain-containing protein [Chloroflexota bacterium]